MKSLRLDAETDYLLLLFFCKTVHTVVLVVLLGLDNSVCLCFCARWPERSLHHRLSGHAVHHGIDGRVQRRQGVGENQPGPELGEIPSPSPSFPQYIFSCTEPSWNFHSELKVCCISSLIKISAAAVRAGSITSVAFVF